MTVHNFSAGPSILPQTVFEEAAKAVENFNGLDLSILEISHRSKDFVSVMDEAVDLATSLLSVPDGYKCLFLTGGASSQFFMTAMNLLNPDETAGYIDTGSWSSKAIKEARNYGKIEVLASSKDQNYNYIPVNTNIPEKLAYLHITSNNTIFGTQFQSFPETSNWLVADMSSDIFSRPVPVEKFALIYAGAQKNMGPAGVTLVIVKEDLLGRVNREIPTMLDYRTHINKNSAFNTPPVFPIYVSMLTLKWLKSNGGVEWAAKRNLEKATLMYGEIDRNPLFVGTAEKKSRSTMNATFVLKDTTLNDAFMDVCSKVNISGIKGHRSVGGFRASMYNAMGIRSVQTLVDVMQDFEKSHG